MTQNENLKRLTEELVKVNNTIFQQFEEVKNFSKSCIYLVLNEKDKVVYVGKTGRTGKLRLREMSTDYRSHTLNRKLLKPRVEKFLKSKIASLSNKSKQQLIESNQINEVEFKDLQKEINTRIKERFKFKLYPTAKNKLSQLEHFLISVYNPIFND